MPTVLLIFGLRFYFYADEHKPIHVHLESSDGRVKIALEPVKPRDIKRALDLAVEYREEFIQKWNEFHN